MSKPWGRFFSNYVCFSKSLNFKKLGYDFKKICSLLEYNNFKKIVLICNAFWIFLLVSFSLVFQNLKLQKLLHFLRISLESDSAFLRDVFNNPRNKGQIGGIFLFLFKHLSWYLIKLPIFESDWWCQEHWLTTLNCRDRLVFEFYVVISTKVY